MTNTTTRGYALSRWQRPDGFPRPEYFDAIEDAPYSCQVNLDRADLSGCT